MINLQYATKIDGQNVVVDLEGTGVLTLTVTHATIDGLELFGEAKALAVSTLKADLKARGIVFKDSGNDALEFLLPGWSAAT